MCGLEAVVPYEALHSTQPIFSVSPLKIFLCLSLITSVCGLYLLVISNNILLTSLGLWLQLSNSAHFFWKNSHLSALDDLLNSMLSYYHCLWSPLAFACFLLCCWYPLSATVVSLSSFKEYVPLPGLVHISCHSSSVWHSSSAFCRRVWTCSWSQLQRLQRWTTSYDHCTFLGVNLQVDSHCCSQELLITTTINFRCFSIHHWCSPVMLDEVVIYLISNPVFWACPCVESVRVMFKVSTKICQKYSLPSAPFLFPRIDHCVAALCGESALSKHPELWDAQDHDI